MNNVNMLNKKLQIFFVYKISIFRDKF